MTWLEVQITTTNEAEEAVTQAFYDAGANGVAIESKDDVLSVWDDPTVNLVDEKLFERPDDRSIIRGYFPDGDKADEKIQEILVRIAKLPSFGLDPGDASLSIKPVEEDWADSWKKYFVPTRVSKHCVVVPSWETYDPAQDEVIIHMDPGAAFGTGTHETTKLCVQAIEDYVRPGDKVIDVGCGTGILSIAAVKEGAKEAVGVDLDPLAIDASNENAERNDVSEFCTFLEGNLLDKVDADEPADLVIANILAQAVVALTPDVVRVIRPGGIFISSGIIDPYVDDVKKALAENGFEVLDTRKLGEWYAVIAKKQ